MEETVGGAETFRENRLEVSGVLHRQDVLAADERETLRRPIDLERPLKRRAKAIDRANPEHSPLRQVADVFPFQCFSDEPDLINQATGERQFIVATSKE